MRQITVNPRHNSNTSTSGYNVRFDAVNKWLINQGLEFNRDYGVGWDWDDDVNLMPIINFNESVDPRIITAFALKWS